MSDRDIALMALGILLWEVARSGVRFLLDAGAWLWRRWRRYQYRRLAARGFVVVPAPPPLPNDDYDNCAQCRAEADERARMEAEQEPAAHDKE